MEPEIAILLDRVRKGNDKLIVAWEQICKLDHQSQRWKDELDRWHGANEKLSSLCTQLKLMGFNDCLYLDDKGNKVRKCLEGISCRVCPSSKKYWENELMDLPNPKVKHSGYRVGQMEFLRMLGGKP